MKASCGGEEGRREWGRRRGRDALSLPLPPSLLLPLARPGRRTSPASSRRRVPSRRARPRCGQCSCPLWLPLRRPPRPRAASRCRRALRATACRRRRRRPTGCEGGEKVWGERFRAPTAPRVHLFHPLTSAPRRPPAPWMPPGSCPTAPTTEGRREGRWAPIAARARPCGPPSDRGGRSPARAGVAWDAAARVWSAAAVEKPRPPHHPLASPSYLQRQRERGQRQRQQQQHTPRGRAAQHGRARRAVPAFGRAQHSARARIRAGGRGSGGGVWRAAIDQARAPAAAGARRVRWAPRRAALFTLPAARPRPAPPDNAPCGGGGPGGRPAGGSEAVG